MANHQIDEATGFVVSPAYAGAFDPQRKLAFLELWPKNFLRVYETCGELGIDPRTFHHHYNIDPEFKRRVDDAREAYVDGLEGLSRENAMQPKAVLERIFQLRALRPEKYADGQKSTRETINIVINGDQTQKITHRENVFEAEIVRAAPLPREYNVIDSQHVSSDMGRDDGAKA